jgi:multisubunit Na+/H+ antiporter MnhB subunit
LLSLVTVALGIAIFLTEKMALHWRDNFKAIKMQQIWNGMLDLITRSAVAYSMRWQSGSLSWYLAGTLTFAIAVSWLALWHDAITAQPVPINLQNAVWYGVVICMFLVVSSVLVVKSTTRLAAAIALTTNGFLTSLLFVVYRSPDILLTQILIETVSTVFLLLILFYMPVFQNDNFSPLKRLVNILISFAVGFTMFIYIMLSTSPQFHTSKNLAADYFAHSLADAGGANAVNVIIVDLRAIDTNGEITVLVMVGLIAFGLLNARRRKSA